MLLYWLSQAGFDTGNASSILDGSDKGITGNDRGFSFNSTHVYVASTSKVVTYYETFFRQLRNIY